MEKIEVLKLIKDNLLEIIPELAGTEIDTYISLVELGANSVDRGELITITLEKLNLNLPRIQFVSAQTIDELADLIIDKTK